MYRVVPNDWRPVEVDSLEPSADRVVRSTRNALVLAGPGAGKTELLAQRACYLLQTGICPYPRRILAISFKRDAAKNLRERVEARCGEDATRFESLTLDAFAKGLVDRFVDSLLPDWRPGAGYEVMTALLPAADIRDWLAQAGIPRKHIEGLSDGAIRRRFDHLCHGIALPFDGESVKPRHRELGLRWWRQQLGISRGKPSLTFPMLNRLAAFLLRTNPKVIAALRETFSFVFMDEFQDTTSAQYDLVQVGFRGTDSVLTAVGDSKQRIMLWAGAMIDVFDVYANDFAAVRHHLSRNYRSAPKLIAMQNTIALTLETGTPEAEPADDGLSGSCSIIEFSTPEDEATYVAELIEDGLKNRGLGPRDFGILARQRTSKMIEPLKAELARRAIRLRDESLLQDLLTEPIVSFLLSVLRLGTRKRDPEAWDVLTTELATLMGSNPEAGHDLIQQHACSLVDHVRSELLSGRPVHSIPGDLTAFVGPSAFRGTYRQYATGSFLQETLRRFSEALKKSSDDMPSPREAVEDLCGFDVVPAMTIHKSKGLEFHTVIFLGLEDSQWWSFASQPEEEKRSFFVAFSRAIARVYFTFSDVRDTRWGRKRQRRGEIGDLYAVLRQAGVQTRDCR